MVKTWKIANLEKYLQELKVVRDKRRQSTPEFPKTPFENHEKGYLTCLESVINDLERILNG